MKNLLNKRKALLESRQSSGFTIIEVMIVLAIAGLIMVIIFIAVPQLQRNQRDNARQSIANRVKAEMETYAGNNQGQYPFLTTGCGAGSNTGKICDFVNRYINGKVNTNDPSSGQAVLTGGSSSTGRPQAYTSGLAGNIPGNLNPGDLYIIYGAKCSGESVTNSGSTNPQTRNYAVVIGLDRAGSGYCVDNG